MRFLIGLFLLGAPLIAAEDRCPAWTKDPEVLKTMGKCPKPGESTLLHSGDSFPELALIVSETGHESGPGVPPPSPRYQLGKKNPTDEEKKTDAETKNVRRDFIADTVLAALKRANARPPMIFLPVSDDTFFQVQKAVSGAAPPGQLELWNKALVQVKDIPGKGEIPATPWQQDYFKSTINDKGQVELRYLEYYGRGTEKFAGKLFDKMAEVCPLLRHGKDIEEPPKRARTGDWQNAYSGGNIDGGPLGTCLLGDNQDPEFGKQFCADASKHIRLPVNWLMVGHHDEVVKFVPRPAGKAPCDFAVMISSPRAAIKALESAPDGKFFEFFFGPGREEKAKLLSRESESRLSSAPVKYFCDAIFGHPEENPYDGPKPIEPGEEPHSWDWIPQAWAGEDEPADADEATKKKDIIPFTETIRNRCRVLTNRQVLAFLKMNEEFAVTQELVEKKMEESKKILKEKLGACDVEFREAPDLFFGGHLVQKRKFDPIDRTKPLTEQFELPEKEMSSLLPNSANAEVVGKSVIGPHPQNMAFADAMKEHYKKLGLDFSFVDTFDAAHTGYGNLHCSAQTIRMCRPGGNP